MAATTANSNRVAHTDLIRFLNAFAAGPSAYYIDEVLQMRDHPSSEDYYYHQDDLFSVYAMTDEAGAVVERYEYGDYGQVSIMAEDGTSRAASLYGNRHTFTGRLLDDEMTLDDGSQVLQYRNRYLATGSGRFLQRDTLSLRCTPGNPCRTTIQNIDIGLNAYLEQYSYVLSSPGVFVDPDGEFVVIIPAFIAAGACIAKTIATNNDIISALKDCLTDCEQNLCPGDASRCMDCCEKKAHDDIINSGLTCGMNGPDGDYGKCVSQNKCGKGKCGAP